MAPSSPAARGVDPAARRADPAPRGRSSGDGGTNVLDGPVMGSSGFSLFYIFSQINGGRI